VLTDVKKRRIPNRLTGAALLIGIVVQWSMLGKAGLLAACAGLLIGGALLLPGWLMGFTGAGDVKLMAAVGAWLGPGAALLATLLSLIAGGVLAALYAFQKGVLKQSMWNTAGLAGWLIATRGVGRSAGSSPTDGSVSAPPVPTTGLRFPFALAICVGAILAMVIKG
jgi:prepilin peptidase CpaA